MAERSHQATIDPIVPQHGPRLPGKRPRSDAARDAQIVEATRRGATHLASEDLQHGRMAGPVIANPFLPHDSGTVVVHIESRMSRPGCAGCGSPAWVQDRQAVELVDLPCFGRPAGLVWHRC